MSWMKFSLCDNYRLFLLNIIVMSHMILLIAIICSFITLSNGYLHNSPFKFNARLRCPNLRQFTIATATKPSKYTIDYSSYNKICKSSMKRAYSSAGNYNDPNRSRKPSTSLFSKLVSHQDSDDMDDDDDDIFKERLDCQRLSKGEFERYDGQVPVVLTNVFAIDRQKGKIKNDRERFTEELMSILWDSTIQYDARDNIEGTIDVFECKLSEFIGSLSDNSDHDDSMYFMNENILRDRLFVDEALKLPLNLFGEDYFQYFPEKIRPRNALVIGGVGARSFLHVDPYR